MKKLLVIEQYILSYQEIITNGREEIRGCLLSDCLVFSCKQSQILHLNQIKKRTLFCRVKFIEYFD